MNTTTTLLLYVGMAIVTYVARRAFLRLPGNFFSSRLRHGLSYIPIGIFAGLIFPSLFVVGNQLVWQPLLLVASAVCLAMMAFTRNVFASFGVGLALVVAASLLQ